MTNYKLIIFLMPFVTLMSYFLILKIGDYIIKKIDKRWNE